MKKVGENLLNVQYLMKIFKYSQSSMYNNLWDPNCLPVVDCVGCYSEVFLSTYAIKIENGTQLVATIGKWLLAHVLL